MFGVARGADLIVYATLIVLWYFYFELLHEVTKNKGNTTRLISWDAIRSVAVKESPSHSVKDSFVFLIRSYNEWASIINVIKAIFQAWYSKIIIVNDWSVDNTVEIVEECKKQYPDKIIYLITHVINRGWWAANKTWFQFLTRYIDKIDAQWIVTFDADWQMDIADMETFCSHIFNPENAGVQAYLWTRFIDWWSATNMPFSRKVILWGSKVITRLFNRLNVTDPHNWYRVLHKDIIPKIHLTSDGMMYASELLDSIRIFDIRFREVPVHIVYTDYSLSKWQKNRNAFKILAELIYKKIFYK